MHGSLQYKALLRMYIFTQAVFNFVKHEDLASHSTKVHVVQHHSALSLSRYSGPEDKQIKIVRTEGMTSNVSFVKIKSLKKEDTVKWHFPV
jgi:hypothetical protein